MTLETWGLGSGDDCKVKAWGVETTLELAPGEWRGHRRLSGWGLRTTLEAIVPGDCRRRWRFSSWGVGATVEPWQFKNGNDVGDLVAWEWGRYWT